MVEWWNGGMVEWWNGGMVEWWNGGMVEWWNGGMVEWWNGGMVEWWNGGVVERAVAIPDEGDRCVLQLKRPFLGGLLSSLTIRVGVGQRRYGSANIEGGRGARPCAAASRIRCLVSGIGCLGNGERNGGMMECCVVLACLSGVGQQRSGFANIEGRAAWGRSFLVNRFAYCQYQMGGQSRNFGRRLPVWNVRSPCLFNRRLARRRHGLATLVRPTMASGNRVVVERHGSRWH